MYNVNDQRGYQGRLGNRDGHATSSNRFYVSTDGALKMSSPCPAATISTRPTASSIRSSSGRAVEQTAALRRGSAIAKCVQVAARQLLGNYYPGSCLVPCGFIYNCTWFQHAGSIFWITKF